MHLFIANKCTNKYARPIMQPQAQFDRIISICKLFLPLCSILREIWLTPGLYLPVQTSLIWRFRFFKVCFPEERGPCRKNELLQRVSVDKLDFVD